jgi:hypothetical protein
MNKLHKLMAIALLAGLIPVFSGCRLLKGEDPLLVRAEQSIRFAYVVTDSFLKFEYDNRQQFPALKPVADRIRVNAPIVLKRALDATEVYKKTRSRGDADVLVQNLAVVETMTRNTQDLTATALP